MEEYIKWLDENHWLQLIFLSLALLSIIVSIYLYLKSRKRKKPVFDKRSINVISDTIRNLGDIDVKYKGDEIDNLTVTKVAFWNNGNETINENDQAPTDKLRISLGEDFIVLESEILFQSSKSNNFQVTNSTNYISISFDYLDPKQGCIIKLIHTGRSSSDVSLLGTFKGSDKLKKVNSGIFSRGILKSLVASPIRKLFFSYAGLRKIIRIFPWLLIILGFAIGRGFFDSDNDMTAKISVAFLSALYLLLGFFILFSRTTMPKGFISFDDDE